MAKRGIIGLRGVALARVIDNTPLKYRSETALPLPFAGSMTRTPKLFQRDLYRDDGIHRLLREPLCEEIELRLAELSLEHFQALGMGVFSETDQRLDADLARVGATYSLRCVTDTAVGLPYYFNWRAFDLTGVRFDSFHEGEGRAKLSEVILTGVATQPALREVKPYAIMRLGEDRENQAACEAFWLGGEQFD